MCSFGRDQYSVASIDDLDLAFGSLNLERTAKRRWPAQANLRWFVEQRCGESGRDSSIS